MIFAASRLTVLAMTAPQPSWKALAITFRLVPGGPDAMMNGLGRFNPSTVVARVGIFPIPLSVAKVNGHPGTVRGKIQERIVVGNGISGQGGIASSSGSCRIVAGAGHVLQSGTTIHLWVETRPRGARGRAPSRLFFLCLLLPPATSLSP